MQDPKQRYEQALLNLLQTLDRMIESRTQNLHSLKERHLELVRRVVDQRRCPWCYSVYDRRGKYCSVKCAINAEQNQTL
jgi:hypothetical protein